MSISFKKSSVSGKIPLATDLQIGEIAINFANKKIFSKDTTGTIINLSGAEEIHTHSASDITSGILPTARGGTGRSDGQAPRLITARNISITGDATWSVSFAGDADVTAALTLSNSGVTAGSYGSNISIPVITIDSKGRVTLASTTNVRSASTTESGVVQLSSATNSTSVTLAATASAVKTVFDLASTAIQSSEKAAINGVATLDATGKIPVNQIPVIPSSVSWNDITSKPTTISGFGITDAVTISDNQIISGLKRFSGQILAWDPVSLGNTVGSIHLGNSSSTANAGGAITFGARDTGSGATAVAGIYVNTDGGYGSRMHLGTTNSYASGVMTAITIDSLGEARFLRRRPLALGNIMLDAGNFNSYSPTLTGVGASGSWGISITGNAATVTNGVYTNGTYANPSWLTSLDSTKLTGTIPDARLSGVYSGFTHKIDGDNTIFTTPSQGTQSSLARTVYGLAEYRNSGSSAVGAIVFKSPTNASGIMVQLEIAIMLYSTARITNIVVQFYRSTATVINNTLKISTGTLDVDVRLATEVTTGKMCVILGTESTNWSYPHVSITRAMFSHSGVTDQYCMGWSTAIETALTNYENISAVIPNTAIVGSITGNAATVTNGVYTSGDQTIAGNKTFSSAVLLTTAGTATNHAVRADRNINAGVGLSGGGNLTADRTITLGTPSSITISSTNSVSGTTHTHAISITPADIGASPSNHDHNGLIYRGTVTDANTVLREGSYGFGGTNLLNFPWTTGYGKLLVYVNDGTTHNNSNNWIWHIIYDTSGRKYFRYKVNTNAWTTWSHESTNNVWHGSADSVSWSGITSKPTTLSGYGITDSVDLTSNQTVAGNKTFSGDTQLSNGGVPLNTIFRFNFNNAGLGWGVQEISSNGHLVFQTRTDSGAWTTRVNFGYSGEITATSFTGNGSGVTNLNASNLASGTIPDSRLTGSYTGLVNLTGSGNVDFSRFLGNTSDSATSPSFTWTNDLDTGIYRIGADDVGITTGGTLRTRINASGLGSTNLTVLNTSISSGNGLSLYGSSNVSGLPTYGISFAGVATFGSHGQVNSDWATYFTMNAATNRGWIFKAGSGASGNVASISGTGIITADGSGLSNVNLSDSVLSILDTPTLSRILLSNNIQSGRKLNLDEEFATGSNNISVYNNSGGSTVTITRLTGQSNIPNSTGNILRIAYNGGTVSPGLGGFTFITQTRSNAIFLYRFKARIPIGYTLTWASNSFGIDGNNGFLSSTAGTGKWTDYSHLVICGSSGTFATTGFFYLTGPAGAVTWDLASATCIDVTNNDTISFRRFEGDGSLLTGVVSSSASTLATARSINGTSFNGSADITTANWGTARNITIGNTVKSVNGSGDVSWTRTEIGVPLMTTSTSVTTDPTESCIGYVNEALMGAPDSAMYSHVYSTLWAHQIRGDYRTGQIALRGKNSGTFQPWRYVLDTGNFDSYALPLGGGGLTGKLLINFNTVSGHDYSTGSLELRTNNGSSPSLGFHRSGFTACQLRHDSNGLILSGTTQATAANFRALGSITADQGFIGNASSATVLATARNINGTPFNGSSDINISEWTQSSRDFPNGTLISTNINYAVSSGDAWLLEIKGNSYSSLIPFDILCQGYIYSDTTINLGGISNGTTLTGLVLLNVGGNLCFWFPYQAYWQGFTVRVTSVTGASTNSANRVTSIQNVAKPAGTKEVSINLVNSITTNNLSNSAVDLTSNQTINGIKTFSNDLGIGGTAIISSIRVRNSQPTITLQDTDHNTAFLHTNNNIFYILRGGVDATSWSQVNSRWPLEINLTNNDATFGGSIDAPAGFLSSSLGLKTPSLGSSWINGFRDTGTSGIQFTNVSLVSSYHRWMSMRTPNGGWSQGILNDTIYFNWATNANIDSNTNNVVHALRIENNGNVIANSFSGSFIGNASSASTLQTARSINGTSFNGSADITTANWGTARNITIGNTTKSVNGSANVSWTLNEIGVAPSKLAYTAVVRVGTWSRIGRTNVSQLGGIYLVSLNHTRDSVVVNCLFEIISNLNFNGEIIQLASGNYSQVSIRLTDVDTNDRFIEVLDSNTGSGDQTYNITITYLSEGTATGISTYTAGAGTVRATLLSRTGGISSSSRGIGIHFNRNGTTDPTGTASGDMWYRSNNLYYNDQGTVRAVAHTGSWSSMSATEANTGTATTARLITADVLRQGVRTHLGRYIQTTAPISTLGINGDVCYVY